MKFRRNDPMLTYRRRELRRNQTDAEMQLWSRIRNRQLHGRRFMRQYSVGPYILDFFCPTVSLAIELDGGQHLEPDNKEYDKVRSDYLKAEGIEVMRFWNHEVLKNLDNVLARIADKVTPPYLPLP